MELTIRSSAQPRNGLARRVLSLLISLSRLAPDADASVVADGRYSENGPRFDFAEMFRAMLSIKKNINWRQIRSKYVDNKN